MVACFIIITFSSILFIRRHIHPKDLKAHHDVAAVVFANIGVLYSVLLGFTVVNVQQRFDKIRENTQIESGYLVDLYRNAEVFEEKDKTAIRKALIDYAENVVKIEWPKMSEYYVNWLGDKHLHDLWQAYYAVEATSTKQQQWYDLSISKLNSLMSARLARMLGSRESLGDEMWAMLIVGAFTMATFICFFGLDNLMSHLLMAGFLSTTTGFLLFLIYSLDTAFSGSLSISPDAMESFLQSLKESLPHAVQ
jgi:hypothetical protein